MSHHEHTWRLDKLFLCSPVQQRGATSASIQGQGLRLLPPTPRRLTSHPAPSPTPSKLSQQGFPRVLPTSDKDHGQPRAAWDPSHDSYSWSFGGSFMVFLTKGLFFAHLNLAWGCLMLYRS